jgi:tetratricopeptide (TPR) repeat protein
MSHVILFRTIEEKCRKLQYDEAEQWAEFLYSLRPGFEDGAFSLAYVYVLKGKYRAAIEVLGDFSSTRAKYILAKCHYEVREYGNALEILRGSEEGYGLLQKQEQQAIFGCMITRSDILKLLGQIADAIGDRELANKYNNEACSQDRTLLLAWQQALITGYFILRHNNF